MKVYYMEKNEIIMGNNDPRIEMYREYYAKAKYAIEKAGLAVTIKDHLAKQIYIATGGTSFCMILAMNTVVIFVDEKRVFYFDSETVEVESIDGGWMQMVDIIYQIVIDTDKTKRR